MIAHIKPLSLPYKLSGLPPWLMIITSTKLALGSLGYSLTLTVNQYARVCEQKEDWATSWNDYY